MIKDMPTETMRFMLDHPLPMINAKQEVEQVKAYFTAIQKKHNPLHEAMKDTKLQQVADWDRASLGWVKQHSQYHKLVQQCKLSMPADRAQANQGLKEWERYPNKFWHLNGTFLPERLGKHYWKWPAGKTKSDSRLRDQPSRSHSRKQ